MKVIIHEQVYESPDGGKVYYYRLSPLKANELTVKYTEYRGDSEYFGKIPPARMPAFARDVLMGDGIITRWEGFTDENDKPIEFKKENIELLPIYVIYDLALRIVRLDEAQDALDLVSEQVLKKNRGKKSKP
uniref:Uncharacterized protein n=1 Tax=viral metagenome TaxID=1070528 RepID=A0A6M3KM33_9ZZZZ